MGWRNLKLISSLITSHFYQKFKKIWKRLSDRQNLFFFSRKKEWKIQSFHLFSKSEGLKKISSDSTIMQWELGYCNPFVGLRDPMCSQIDLMLFLRCHVPKLSCHVPNLRCHVPKWRRFCYLTEKCCNVSMKVESKNVLNSVFYLVQC